MLWDGWGDLILFRRGGESKVLVKEAIFSPAAQQEELWVGLGWFADGKEIVAVL